MVLLLILLSVAQAADVTYTLFSNHSSLHVAPKPNLEENINFLLFTRKNPMIYQLLKVNDSSCLDQSNYDVNQTTKIIVHGWIFDNQTSMAIETLKNAFINTTDYNILLVDWSKLADGQYKAAKSNVTIVSLVLIRFLKFLMYNGVPVSKFHLIGHCLGAHIVGHTGRHFKEDNKTIDFIIGLDPAYPLYKFSTDDQCLDKSDAHHVEVVHSSSGYWGYRIPMGHVDYYPNGGKHQPGCEDHKDLCTHHRAVLYYAYSITSQTPFTAILWESYERVYYFNDRMVNMSGLHLNISLKGTFYFRTMSSPPYALGDPKNWRQDLMDEES